ncbi:hybrid sensor histidine kinase/response regulator transcription factor [Cyclobacterium plantarum]|uniref:histidine kinase n=1 Tax=Cyclobacterium plantarum TaxID=2716263 RepID=A0ABX0H901_9BACT|nr:hybrid sensor histidine kinase/response regulator transcription factor [Cyclobacterium plantarum]NHE58149.1 response regulator [Cyclobacterium plantarum]
MKRTSAFILLLWSLLLFAELKGENDPEISFRKLKTGQNLSSGNIQAIFQDRDGYLWFGTNNGLNRYDGSTLNVYYSDEGDSSTVSSSSIYKIFQGPDGDIWLKDFERVFNIYRKDKGIFESDMEKIAFRYNLRSKDISKVFEDSKGDFWFLHPYEGITHYKSDINKSSYFFHKASLEGSLSYNSVTDIQEDIKGNFWVIYDNGWIDILSGESLKVIKKVQVLRNADENLIYNFELVMDDSGDAWAFCPDYALGVFHISADDYSIQNIHEKSPGLRLNNALVKSVMAFSKEQVWLGTDHGGINIIDKGKGKVRYLVNKPENPQSLSHNAVYALYLDQDGIVWVGTHKRGIDLYHPHFSRFGMVRREIDPNNPIPKNDVNAVEEMTAGQIIMGSNGGGLWQYDHSSGVCLDLIDKTGLEGDIPPPDLVVVDLFTDSFGTLWIGTYQKGLYAFDGKTFKHYAASTEKEGALRDNNVWKIFEDSKGRLWIGTLREGLFLMDRKNDTFLPFAAGVNGVSLNNKYITGINEDSFGNIWVGGSRGIDVFHPEKGYQRYFSGNENDQSGLKNHNISEIIRDPYGIIWVGSSGGLFYYDEEAGIFHGFDQSNGLENHFLVSLIADQSGDLWLSSQEGLTQAKVNRSNKELLLEFRFFNTGDGLQGNYFNKNAAFLSDRGEVFIGGSDGVNFVNPVNFPFIEKEPEIVFTEFQLFNQAISVNQRINGRAILSSNLDKKRSIQLKHHENIFSVSFSSLNYLNPEKSRFLYRLEGFNKEWVKLSKPPFKVSFTNLDPGNYTLMVKATNADGIWGEEAASLSIEILSPFWLTPFAYFLYVILFLSIFLLAWRWFVNQERQRLQRLEEIKENQRLAELDQMKSRFFNNVSHEFKTPLTLILAPIDKIIMDRPESPEIFQFTTIQKNAKKLLLMVNQLLEVRNMESDSLKLETSEGEIVAFIEENVRAFQSLSVNNQIGLTFGSNVRSIPTSFDPDKMSKIIYNLLSNAFKFTPKGGEVNVGLEFQQQGLRNGLLKIKVQDSGAGMGKETLNRIFDRYFTLNTAGNQGTGIGLSLAQEYTKLHGGLIEVESQPGRGTLFVISLPLSIREGYLTWEEFFMDTGREELIASGQSPIIADRPTLLLVEDNHELRHYLAEVLKETYIVDQAGDGKEALEKALSKIPDLILSDILMPEMDGIALCSAIKSNIKTSHVPVVLLTAKTAEEDHLLGLDSGCNLYLEKPFSLEILLSALKNLLEERSRLQKHYRKIISVQTSDAEMESLDDKLIQKAVALVEKEIENPDFSVEILSKSLGMSRVHLYKKINSLTGQNPLEFIRSIRLQRAAQLLEMNQYTVSEVAYKVGYNNAKYFSKHFKANYGKLPSQFQKNNENE